MHLSLTGFATIETSKLIVNTMLMLCAIDERGQEINMRDVNVPKALLLADAMDVSAAAQAIMAGKISECIGVFSRSGSSRRGLPEKAARAWLHAVVRCGAFDKELLRGARRDHAGLAGRVRDRVGRRVRRLPAGIEMWAPKKFPQVAKYQSWTPCSVRPVGPGVGSSTR